MNVPKALKIGAKQTLVSLLIASLLTVPAEARTPASAVRSGVEIVREAQSLSDLGKTDEAVKNLNSAIEKETNVEQRGLLRLSLAMIFFRAARDADAELQFNQALADGLRVPEYAQYHLGILQKKSGRLKEARAHFEKVIQSKAPGPTQADARYQLAEIFVTEKEWSLARSEYEILRKKMKSSEYYPEILFNLMRAHRHLGGSKSERSICPIAREIYSKFPTHILVRDWGSRLESNLVDEKKVGCSASAKDLKTRIRRLQLGGEAERAEKELAGIKGLQSEDGEESGQYGIDSMLANHLTNEGQTDEALKLLLRHYETQRQRPPFQMLFAKTTSRAGEYQAAIGAYMKAFELAPRGKDAAGALFQAAFTSYQIQDYDGAAEKFGRLVKAFPGSRFARDGQWHLAWMSYLRGDYSGAYEGFNYLAKAPKVTKKRKKRGAMIVRSDAQATDRLRYWSAMSLLRMGRNEEAVGILNSLVRDPSIGYYSILSYYRLQDIPGAKLPPGIETRLGLKKSDVPSAQPSEEEIKAAAEAVAEAAEEAAPGATAAADEESDSNETAGDQDSSEGEDDDAGTQVADERKGSSNFRDPLLMLRFERARDLAFVGLESAARRELGEIERRVNRADDRRLLMNEYAQVKNFNRSSTIGELGFGVQRLRGGLSGESRAYWEYAYPRAWDATVTDSSKSTNVPEELIWGIMRAESQYRSEVQSPVGALGLMQVMPFTGRQLASLMSWSSFETRSLLDPNTNIKLGSRYLQRLLEKFSGNVPLAAASYNAGPHRVHAWVINFGSLGLDEFIEHIPFIETRNYVKKVVRNYQIYSLLYSGGTHSLRWLVQPVGVSVEDKIPTKEAW